MTEGLKCIASYLRDRLANKHILKGHGVHVHTTTRLISKAVDKLKYNILAGVGFGGDVISDAFTNHELDG